MSGLVLRRGARPRRRAGYYGNPYQTDGLNNYQIGASLSAVCAIRDRSQHTGSLTSIDLWKKADSTSGPGTNTYWNGTGGSWTVRCESDNGSGLPSGSLISAGATVTATTTSSNILVQRFTFGTAIADVAGTLRHFRINNADGAPATNFCSINSQDLSNGDSSWQPNPLQPTYADADRAFLANLSGAGFSINRDRYPIFALNYADGSVYGESYYDALSNSGARAIGTGGKMVRFNITPSATKIVKAVHVRVYKQAGTTSTLTANLRNLTGATLLGTTSFTAASVNTGSAPPPFFAGDGYGARYKDWTFTSPITLTSGVNYSLELASTEASAPYISFPSRRGGGAGFGVNFAALDRFLDGYWEYTTDGTTWNTHSTGTTEQQMQAYFDLS